MNESFLKCLRELNEAKAKGNYDLKINCESWESSSGSLYYDKSSNVLISEIQGFPAPFMPNELYDYSQSTNKFYIEKKPKELKACAWQILGKGNNPILESMK